MSKVFQDILRIGFSKILMISFGLSTSILVARILGPDKNGIIAALLVYPAIFVSFGSLGVRQSTVYLLGKAVINEDKIKTSITQIWVITSLLSVISCIILLALTISISESFWLILLAVLPIPFNLYINYNSGLFLGKNDIASFSKVNWIPSLVTFVLTIILVFILNFEIIGYLIALIAGPLLVSLLLFIRNDFFRFFSLQLDVEIIKKMVMLGLVYALGLLLVNLNLRIDVILINVLSNNFELGIYSKGNSLAEYILQIPLLMSTLIFSNSAISKDNFGFSVKVVKLLRLSVIVSIFVGGILYMFSDELVLVLLGQDYRSSAKVLQILLPGILFLSIFTVLSMDLAGKGKPWTSVKAMLPALFLNILLNLFLIPKYGAFGAAVSSTFSYFVASIVFLSLYSTQVNLSLGEIIIPRKSDLEILSVFFKSRTK